MNVLQGFALNNIHCSPGEDKQFRFHLVRMTKPKEPAITSIKMFNFSMLDLPDRTHPYHVYVIGDVPPSLINLRTGGGCLKCSKEKWINVEEDMNERHFILQIYNDDGYNLPRANIYYKVLYDGRLVFAVKVDVNMRLKFNVDSYKYLRVYSNPYYRNETSGDKIVIKSTYINSKKDLIDIQRDLESMGKKGKFFFYVNGMFTPTFDINTKVGNVLEYMLDTGVNTMERFTIKNLRTFPSKVDNNQLKYFIFRKKLYDYILYSDDLEIYIVGKDKDKKDVGVYYYQNRDEALRNVTDKDFSLLTDFVNNQARMLATKFGFGMREAEILLYTRDPMWRRSLIYSALKLHELYNLPDKIEYDVLSNSGIGIEEFSNVYLEASPYWKLAGLEDLSDLTPRLAMDTIGYSATAFYFGNTPNATKKGVKNLEVPFIYQYNSFAYEYDQDGLMTGYYTTNGPYYPVSTEETKHVEFIKGRNKYEFEVYEYNETTTIDTSRDYRIVKALYVKNNRINDWSVASSKEYKISKGKITFTHETFEKYMILYLDDPYMVDLDIDISYKFPVLELKGYEIQKGVKRTVPLSACHDTVEVFLNKRRLVEHLDFYVEYPNVIITNKEYLDYTLPKQKVHIRCTGFNIDSSKINDREVIGFVSHGVLTRNKHYDIRDDRVFSTWIKGKLVDRKDIKFAEKDKTVRVDDKLNGQPYSIADKILSVKKITSYDTLTEFSKSEKLNERISGMYDLYHPEPYVDPFNVIPDHHYIYSPLVSTIIRDVVNGKIPEDVYTRNYQAKVIRDYIDENYSLLARHDPLSKGLPTELVEIHPDYGNEQIVVNLFQYRFIYNVVKLLTEGDMDRCNLSGYLLVDKETSEHVGDNVYDPNGLTPYD